MQAEGEYSIKVGKHQKYFKYTRWIQINGKVWRGLDPVNNGHEFKMDIKAGGGATFENYS